METTLGERFKQIRKNLNMTQKEFAESLGVTQTTISGIEKDSANTSLTLAKLISLQYGISEDWILNGTGQMYYFPSEWDTDNIAGLMKKLDAMKILFDKNIESRKSDKSMIYCIVESFGYFTSLISGLDATDEECSAYLNLLCQLFDKMEQYIFHCSSFKKGKKANFEDLYHLKEQEMKLQQEMTEIVGKITSILLTKHMN